MKEIPKCGSEYTYFEVSVYVCPDLIQSRKLYSPQDLLPEEIGRCPALDYRSVHPEWYSF